MLKRYAYIISKTGLLFVPEFSLIDYVDVGHSVLRYNLDTLLNVNGVQRPRYDAGCVRY